MEIRVQLIDCVALVVAYIGAFLLMLTSAYIRGVGYRGAIKQSVFFALGFVCVALWVSLSQKPSLFWNDLFFSHKNIDRLSRVLLTASTYMLIVWQQRPLYAIRNGLIFTVFSFLTFPLFDHIFGLCGL